MKIIEEFGPLYEMANYKQRDTGLPYDIWIDSAGKNRSGLQHNNRRIKVTYNGNALEMDMDEPFTVRAGNSKNFKKLKSVITFLHDYHKALDLHWNLQITDAELGIIFKLVNKRKYSVEDAIKYVLEEYV